jgi:quinol monooxygenase YgiN
MSHPAVVLEVHMEAVPGREQELEIQLRALLAPTRSEPGCIAYELHCDPEHAGRFMFYEKFKDQAALDDHLASPHFVNFVRYRSREADPVARVDVARWSTIV